MKLNIKKFIGVLAFATLLSSCDTTNESGYVPADYAFPTTFTLAEDDATDTSIVVSYASSSVGKGYYVSVPSGTAAPTSTQVHAGTGFLQSGSFDVDGSSTTAITLETLFMVVMIMMYTQFIRVEITLFLKPLLN